MAIDLRSQCHTTISGNEELSPAELFKQMADWCQANDVQHDIYGEGEEIQAFESKVAELLGFEAGLFVISGTMTQPTVLELVCKQKNNPLVAMHESSHIYRHERQGYQLQNRFNILPIGNPFRTWTVDDLTAWPDDIAAVLYELPMREIGGQLPKWEDLQSIKAYCGEQNIHLHMDGARLWECAAYYQKSYQDIAQGFDTAYVSLYKGINGLGGSMLLGDKDFIEKASIWMKRQGGNVYHRSPYIVSAAMQFDQRIEAMPALFERTLQLYQILQDYPQFTLNPAQPNANMLHLYLPVSYENAVVLRDRLAEEKGVWLGHPQVTPLPEQSQIEWYVGDRLLNLSDTEFIAILDWLVSEMT
ncbi:threonine aldolase [Vibrio sp. T187]|uniref:threonine aldolase family protein n=1 Tax=Vibrio TaxID=662 RepID=UPI0010C9C58C|nr:MULTISPECIES: beta-eliminating lyase-related protein [Vibrio]MBW3695666.1 threonine aldolase [Vibrio sp. T187]